MKICLDCTKKMRKFILDAPRCDLYFRGCECEICGKTSPTITILNIEESQLLCSDAWFHLALITCREDIKRNKDET